jgi:hypothetical protein
MIPVLTPPECEPAAEARRLDFDAAINDDVEPGLVGQADRVFVDHAVLKPDRLRADGNRVARDLWRFIGTTAYVEGWADGY